MIKDSMPLPESRKAQFLSPPRHPQENILCWKALPRVSALFSGLDCQQDAAEQRPGSQACSFRSADLAREPQNRACTGHSRMVVPRSPHVPTGALCIALPIERIVTSCDHSVWEETSPV